MPSVIPSGETIEGLDLARPLADGQRDAIVHALGAHGELKPEYRYVAQWQDGDVLMWEDIGTIHRAVADYGPHEPRLMKRCQVMADRYAVAA